MSLHFPICAVSSPGAFGGIVLTGYIYDADGTRVGKGTIERWGTCDPAANGFQPTADYILGPGGEQLTEMGTDENGQMAWKHTNVWAGGNLLATYDSDGLHYHLSDWLGTRRVQTDAAGVIEDACASLPYGDALSCIGPTFTTEHHFTGKERDAESGNDYFGARYYASSMGRFMSPDPRMVSGKRMVDPQQWNMYAYVRNNPFAFFDPDGKELQRVIVRNQTVTVDSSIRSNVVSFIRDAKDSGFRISPNVGFRTTAEQTYIHDHPELYPVSAKPGTSPHEAGVAVDFNGVRQLSSDDKDSLSDIGTDDGLPWAGVGDPMHFGVYHASDFPKGPFKTSLQALQALIQSNQAQWDNRQQVPIPIYNADYEESVQVNSGPPPTIETETPVIDTQIEEQH